ncbi:hypothetical protein BGP77_11620, partial [Saccharospirillum sp. MSK14-1]|uniref:FAD-binding oxidoreductase n=1 Tax=Saccharospirillum sp. MSK14-1 TaxID=1897632 RepID=UPI000D37A1F7
AKGSCQIGGIASTNAGGSNVLLNGMARDNILGIEAVLADGRIVNSTNVLLKNNTGYDLKQLFIGSEGTLAVITRLNLKLGYLPPAKHSALLAVSNFEHCLTIKQQLQRQLNDQLSAFEVMWQDFYEKSIKSDYIERKPLPAGHPYYVIVEYNSGANPAFEDIFMTALNDLLEQGLADDVVIAQNSTEQKNLWAIRENIEPFRSDGNMVAFDISMPTKHMTAYVDRIRQTMTAEKLQLTPYFFGHIGDCNLHIIFTLPESSSITADDLDAIVYDNLSGLSGSISAEHGIGKDRLKYLPLSRSEIEIELMRTIKRTMDSELILNPGKIIEC